jgi:predicted acylesterase/phospholipase RssA
MMAIMRSWSVVSGVSVGAVNAAHLAQWPVGEEAAALVDLWQLWHGLRTRDVHRRWCPFGKLSFWKTGLRDLRPLERFLRKNLDPSRVRDSGRRLIVGAVTRATSEEVEWTEADADVLVDAVVASCAIPFAFEPQLVRGVAYVDHGVRTVCNIGALLRSGCDDIDAIACFPEELPPFPEPSNALDAGLHAVDAQNHQILADDLAIPLPPGVALNIYRPDRDLGDGMDFSPPTNAWRWQLGEGVLG